MKKIVPNLIICVIFFFFSCEQALKPTDAAALIKNIEWLETSSPCGSECIRIQDEGLVIYFDPAGITITENTPKADLILVTHSHSHHLSVANIRQLTKDDTQIVTMEEIKYLLEERFPDQKWRIQTIKVGEKVKVEGIEIEGVSAYNTDDRPNHTKDTSVAFIINYRGVRIYHSADTDVIPEMQDMKNIDIALLGIVGGFFEMDGKEAVQAINLIKPKYVIPMHWLKNNEKDIEYLKANCPATIELHILTQVKP